MAVKGAMATALEEEEEAEAMVVMVVVGAGAGAAAAGSPARQYDARIRRFHAGGQHSPASGPGARGI